MSADDKELSRSLNRSITYNPVTGQGDCRRPFDKTDEYDMRPPTSQPIPPTMNHCKDCKAYTPLETAGGTQREFGLCKSKWFVSTDWVRNGLGHPLGEVYDPLDNRKLYVFADDIHPTTLVGEDFGCIHFEQKQIAVEAPNA